MQSDIEETASWLATLTANLLQREATDLSAPFIPSEPAREVCARLTTEIMGRRNVRLPESILDRCPSPLSLARWMCRNADRIYEPLIRFRLDEPADDPTGVLFCVHPVSGVGTVYKSLAQYLAPQLRTFALTARGLNPAESLPDSFDEMISRYADRVAVASDGAVPHLLGWSFGGHIAAAVALELQRRGIPVGLLVLIDSWISDEASQPEPPPLPGYDDFVRELFAKNLPDRMDTFDDLDEESQLRALVEYLIVAEAFTEKARQMPYPALRRTMRVVHRLEGMYRRSVPLPYSGPTVLVRGSDNSAWGVDAVAQWQALAGNLKIETIPFHHLAMLIREESIAAIAEIVGHHCAEFAARDRSPVD